MNRLAKLPLEERTVYFAQAAARLALPAAAVEKDFWVCWTLARLFSSERLAPRILFKGGTSLSKVFNLIRRFSEDIDLILDWNEVAADDPRAERSRTQQDRYNHELIDIARITPEGLDGYRQHLTDLIDAHAQLTGSAWSARILDEFRDFVGKFWLVKPKAASLEALAEDLRRAA